MCTKQETDKTTCQDVISIQVLKWGGEEGKVGGREGGREGEKLKIFGGKMLGEDGSSFVGPHIRFILQDYSIYTCQIQVSHMEYTFICITPAFTDFLKAESYVIFSCAVLPLAFNRQQILLE